MENSYLQPPDPKPLSLEDLENMDSSEAVEAFMGTAEEEDADIVIMGRLNKEEWYAEWKALLIKKWELEAEIRTLNARELKRLQHQSHQQSNMG